MAKVIEHETEKGRFSFICPGCGDEHSVPTNANDQLFHPHKWRFNGDVNKPTFKPSLLVRSGHYAYDTKKDTCWCTYNEEQRKKGEKESSYSCYRCHSFITDGKIQFLSDCTHKLAGQTVELPDLN